MKRQRIYLDTSVIGGCLDDEFAPWSNGLYQVFREGHFVPVVSHLVAAELVLAPQPVQAKYQELLDFESEMLGESPEASALAAKYGEHRMLPKSFTADGLHIALATVAAVDILVSWKLQAHRAVR